MNDKAHKQALTAGEPYYRFEAQLSITPIGLVPEGLRMDLSFQGRVTGGTFDGARVWGTDPLLIRSDGVGILDVHKMIAKADTIVYEHVRGYCLPPAGLEMPPLDVIARPDFEFPDVPFAISGFSTFAAPSEQLASLNTRLARIVGHSSFATGRLVIEAHLLEEPDVAALMASAA